MAESPDDPFVPIIHTILTTAMIDIQRRGYPLLPLPRSDDGASDAEVIRGVLGDTQLAGTIRETTSAEAFTSCLLADLSIPVAAALMIEVNPARSESSFIRTDEGASVCDVPSDCALVGPSTGADSRRTVFLAGPNTNHAHQSPIARTFGTRFTMYSLSNWEPIAACQAALCLLDEDPSVSFIALADDSQAPGVSQATADSGLSVPGGLLILGFDNQDHRSASVLGLMTVGWPLKDMIEAAVSPIINMIGGRPSMTDIHLQASTDEEVPDGTPITTTPIRPVWRLSVARRTS